jgi:ABC-type multidrug transport system ATPase subunit
MMMPVGTNDQPAADTGTATTPAPVASFDSTGTIRIGRDPGNDVVLDDLWVSQKHAEIRKAGDNDYQLVDLGSTNGLHLNGARVPRGKLAVGDTFTIGRHEFLFDGAAVYHHDDQGPTSIVADDIGVQVGKAQLIDDVSFALRHGTLLGIIGPSGCGKSTLLKAMTGIHRATQGRLLYDDRDLYRHYDQLRNRIGMVPQDDVMHRQLTVRRALRFAASLRYSDDVPRHERWKRVDEVIDLLGLTSRARQRIDTLSGGQRKRTSVALELLTEPSLLALDEPTTGLDPALDKEVMKELRLLADRGRTVVVVTHSVLQLGLCDHVLVMCLGGRMGYFGPPDEVLGFFGSQDYADVFDKVTNDPDRWSQIYRNSDTYRKHVGEVVLELAQANLRPTLPTVLPTPRPEPATTPVAAPVVTVPAAAAAHGSPAAVAAPAAPAPMPVVAPAAVLAAPARPGPSKKPDLLQRAADRLFANAGKNSKGRPDLLQRAADRIFADSRAPRNPPKAGLQDVSITHRALHPWVPIRQFITLSMRMITVIASDRGYALFLLGLPLVLALLSRAVPGSKGLTPDPLGASLQADRLLVIFIVGAAFMGMAVAVREIVNESTIYRRERAIGLSPTAYLASKLLIFILIDSIQVIIFVYLALLGQGGPKAALVFKNPTAEVMFAVILVAVASTSLGLLASVLVKTSDQTTPVLVVSVMTQLVLCGGLFQIAGNGTLEVISWIDPSRWGFAASAATTNLVNFPLKDPLWDHSAFNWWRSIMVLLVQIVVLAVGTRFALRKFEPGQG